MKKAPRKSSGRMASKGFPNPIDVWVGRKIRERRTIIGMTQTTLGTALGLTFQQVQKYETGTNRLSCSRLYDLARTLGVPFSYFFTNLPQEVESQSPGRLAGAVPGLIEQADWTSSRVGLQVAGEVDDIEDDDVRSNVLKLIRALGRTQGKPKKRRGGGRRVG